MTDPKKKRTIKNILKSKKTIAILLIAAAVLIGFAGGLIQYQQNKQQSTLLEMWYYSSQIIGSIFMTSGVIIAVWQYYLSSQSAKDDLEIIQVQRAIDLAEYYKDNILKFYPAIIYVFKNSKIYDIIDSIKLDQLHDFDEHEINMLFSQKDIMRLKQLQTSDEFCKSVLEANTIYELGLNIPAIKESVKGEDNKTHITLEYNKTLIALAFMSNLVKDLLNNLEYFALHFHHYTADESVVYQSLHQSYLETVQIMYYFIAKTNNNSTDKYYTNIIWLFDTWRQKQSDQNNERSQKVRELQSHGTVIRKKN